MASPRQPVQPVAPPVAQTTRAAAPTRDAVPVRRPVRRRVVAAPPPSADHALALLAREVLEARGTCPQARWLLPEFARDVDLVRRQLGPLRDRRMLAASFERESARLAALRRLADDPTAAPLPLDPLEAAYAIRWLELTDGGGALPAWHVLIGADPAAATGAAADPSDTRGAPPG